MYTPTHVLHGTTNAVKFLQSTVASIIPNGFRTNIMYWMKDILGHAESIKDLLNDIRTIFRLFAEFNIKFHPVKCEMFSTQSHWCRHLLMVYDSTRIPLTSFVRFNIQRLMHNLKNVLCTL